MWIPGTSTCSGRALPTNGDGIPEDNEIGPTGNRNFGVSTGRRPDPDLRRAVQLGLQRRRRSRDDAGLSVTGAWYHRRFHNVEGQYNTLVDPVADWTPFRPSIR